MIFERPKSLKELALEHLREAIINGKLEMGQMLSERIISDELGISKSPVREALARLRDEGLVIIEPQKGVRVFSLSKEEVAQICDFRLAIEVAAFELALQRNPHNLAQDMKQNVDMMEKAKEKEDIQQYLWLDTQFHQLIFKNADNPYLNASYNQYVGKIAALRNHLSQYPSHTDLSLEEHQAILAAVRDKDFSKIRSLLTVHIARTKKTYAALYAV